jgi:hypothetical protein
MRNKSVDVLLANEERWGKWHYNAENNALDYIIDGAVRYYIDLDRMATSAQCLDWIFQVAFKTWMTDHDRTCLLAAIDKKVDPQSRLCGGAIGPPRSLAPGQP